MVVILDSQSNCTPYHCGNTDRRMFSAVASLYNALNGFGVDFYLGFIETATFNTLRSECRRGVLPSMNFTTTAYSGNYANAMKRAIQKLEIESARNDRLNIIIFMSWSGCGDAEISDANDVLKVKKNSIDVLYTMGCCGKGTFGGQIDSWKTTLGTKYGGHLPNGMMNGDIGSMLTRTETSIKKETAELTSVNKRVLLEGIDMSKEIIVKINGMPYTYGSAPFNNHAIISMGGRYYLDLTRVAAAIGKDNLNDVDVELEFTSL